MSEASDKATHQGQPWGRPLLDDLVGNAKTTKWSVSGGVGLRLLRGPRGRHGLRPLEDERSGFFSCADDALRR